jgi:hypothetical protein
MKLTIELNRNELADLLAFRFMSGCLDLDPQSIITTLISRGSTFETQDYLAEDEATTQEIVDIYRFARESVDAQFFETLTDSTEVDDPQQIKEFTAMIDEMDSRYEREY